MPDHFFNGAVVGRVFLAGLVAVAGAAQAAHTVYVYQSGPDVVAQGSGPINTAGITLFGNTGNYIPDVQANVARIASGIGNSTQWQGITGPTSFGAGAAAFSSSNTGDFVGLVGVNSSLRLPENYVSGAPLQNSSRWPGRTLASLGLVADTYNYTWGTGANSDRFTLLIGTVPPPAPVTNPASVPALSDRGVLLTSTLLGLLSVLWMRRRTRQGTGPAVRP